MPCKIPLLSTFLLLTVIASIAQSKSQHEQKDTIYTLQKDTLFTNQNFMIYVGQPIVMGMPSGERGWYKTISFKSGASWPLLLSKKAETALDIEYQMDPSVRERDKVKEHITPGDTLFVTKIKKYGKERFGYWYIVTMGQKQGFLSLNFKCDVINAIKTKEIVVPER
jgi:hypothetical protein